NLRIADVPTVIQVNKRDLPDALPMELLKQVLNPHGRLQGFEAVASEFKGGFEPRRAVSTTVLEKVAQKACSAHPTDCLPHATRGLKRPSERDILAPMLRTPLYQKHVELGARMVEFAGYEMPLHYTGGINEEHLTVRSAAGLFDVSHMAELQV